MARRLMDVESSFLPDVRPSSASPHARLAARATRGAVASPSAEGSPSPPSARDRGSPRSAPAAHASGAPPTALRDARQTGSARSGSDPSGRDPSGRDHSGRDPSGRDPSGRDPSGRDPSGRDPSGRNHNTSQRESSTSPSTAAEQRSRRRAAAANGALAAASDRPSTPLHELADDAETTPTQFDRSLHSTEQTLVNGGSPENLQEHPSELPGPTPRGSQHAQHRQPSHHSSISSYQSMAITDATIAANDYTASTKGPRVRPSQELPRPPSLGSMVSSMSSRTELRRASHLAAAGSAPLPATRSHLERPAEDDDGDAQLPPQTPRVAGYASEEPTDTVIAQHVRNIQVPETVVREYRASHSSEAPAHLSTPYFGRGKTHLTLKEQNVNIDKLSKENFDLKLKIHFLSQALERRSDEGVKDLVSRNAQLETDLIKSKRENQGLRKRLRDRDVGSRARDRDEDTDGEHVSYRGSQAARSSHSLQAQLEEEIARLREHSQSLAEENERLSRAGVSREAETRALAGQLQSAKTAMSVTSSKEGADWRSSFENEAVRRRRAEKEVQELHAEMLRLRNSGNPGRLRIRASKSDVDDTRLTARSLSQHSEDRDIGSLSGSTLVSQLRGENADLRRHLGAQTSMLTSRNREREHLQQEIEDLKIIAKHGDGARPSNGDGLLDRSVSRNNQRSQSRASAGSYLNQMSDSDKEQYENTQGLLRDENATLKMRNQDMQRELNLLNDNEEYIQRLEDESEEAARAIDEANAELEYLESMVIQKDEVIVQLQADLHDREENLQLEMQSIRRGLDELIDGKETDQNTIRDLQEDLTSARGELETLENSLGDVSDAKERLEVQAESSSKEIAFLRQEQEGDKIQIGDLESALRTANAAAREDSQRQRDVDEIEAQSASSKEEIRKLRKTISAKESQFESARERLEELEGGLGKLFGNYDGNNANLFRSITQLQHELEDSSQRLDDATHALGEHKSTLQDREALLESSGHDNRKLSDALEREKQARKHDKNEFERMRSRNPVANVQIRNAELETARAQDAEKLSAIEKQHGEQLQARHELLISLWTRLTRLCGPDWASRNGVSVGDKGLNSGMLVQYLPAFSDKFGKAVSIIEQAIGSFRSRLNAAEEQIWQDFQTLNEALESRVQRLDVLEDAIKQTSTAAADVKAASLTDLSRLKAENKQLRKEIKFLKQGSFALPGLRSPLPSEFGTGLDLSAPPPTFGHVKDGSPSVRSKRSSAPGSSRARQQPAAGAERGAAPSSSAQTVLGANGTNAGSNGTNAGSNGSNAGSNVPVNAASTHSERTVTQQPPHRQLSQASASAMTSTTSLGGVGHHPPASAPAALAPSEQRWLLKLGELKRQLVLEREGRLLDRQGARARLEERSKEVDGLRGALAREKDRVRMDSVAGSSRGEGEADVD